MYAKVTPKKIHLGAVGGRRGLEGGVCGGNGAHIFMRNALKATSQTPDDFLSSIKAGLRSQWLTNPMATIYVDSTTGTSDWIRGLSGQSSKPAMSNWTVDTQNHWTNEELLEKCYHL